jgi:hypothetical protein
MMGYHKVGICRTHREMENRKTGREELILEASLYVTELHSTESEVGTATA